MDSLRERALTLRPCARPFNGCSVLAALSVLVARERRLKDAAVGPTMIPEWGHHAGMFWALEEALECHIRNCGDCIEDNARWMGVDSTVYWAPEVNWNLGGYRG